MNWDAIAALGQAVSALALVLVFAQIRHARAEMRRSVRRERFDAARQMFVTTATDQPLASALARLWTQSGSPPIPFQEFATGHGLTDGEARQVNSFMHAVWQGYE